MSKVVPDPREVLGLEPDDGAAAIRRAFRRLAMRWHPDRNGDPAALEQFRRIRAAYESLIELEDESVAQEAARQPRGADRRDELWLSIEEAARGCEKAYRLLSAQCCGDCEGSGWIELARSRMCTVCSGSGRVRGGGRHLENCTACDGRGFSTRAQCDMCKGSGEVSGEQSVSVHVRPGLLDGDQLRLRGLGEAPAGEGEGEPGDLLLTVRLRVHPVFRMQRRELHVELPVPAFTLLTGGKVAVPLPVGEEIVSLPAGEAVAHELRLAGRGFPGRGGEPAGDAVVSIRPVLPGALTPEQRKMLARLEKQFEKEIATHYPEIAGFRAALDAASD
ncbi:MAG: DnaJ domain-containing protein [Zoogloeaceae bacterium]|nr:DnaJ domain-containing protein [Zoogloeaceae bacterium]